MGKIQDDNDQTIEHAITDEITGHTLPVIVRLYKVGVGITIQGYGNTSVVGDAEIVYLDYFGGKLQVVIHNRHENDDPVTIDLEGAHHVYGD